MKNPAIGSGPSHGDAFQFPKFRFSKAAFPKVRLTVGHILLAALLASALLWVGIAAIVKVVATLLY